MPRVDWLSELQTSLKRSMKVKLGGVGSLGEDVSRRGQTKLKFAKLASY
jgi:hypothetical protein